MTWLQIHVSKVVRRPGRLILSRGHRFTVPWWFLALLFWLGMATEVAHSWLPYGTAACWLCNSPPCYKAVQAVPTGLVKVSCGRVAKHQVQLSLLLWQPRTMSCATWWLSLAPATRVAALVLFMADTGPVVMQPRLATVAQLHELQEASALAAVNHLPCH